MKEKKDCARNTKNKIKATEFALEKSVKSMDALSALVAVNKSPINNGKAMAVTLLRIRKKKLVQYKYLYGFMYDKIFLARLKDPFLSDSGLFSFLDIACKFS